MALLEIRNLSKRYPGTVALQDVNLRFTSGRIHALLGKNGAGKSTLIKILAGSVKPSGGQVYIDDRAVPLASPADAFAHGIVTVHQELSLVPELSVAENILLGRLPRIGKTPIVDWAAAHAGARDILRRLQVEIDPKTKARNLGVAQQQVVEIAKAMSTRPRVLLLDEPTSALAAHETQVLFQLMRQLRGQDVVIIYITHRLQELREIADTVTVLRDGCCVGTIEVRQATTPMLVNMIFGESLVHATPGEAPQSSDEVLRVEGLARDRAFEDIHFGLRRGEVLGLAGMLGSGRTELLRALFGADVFTRGRIHVGGAVLTRITPMLAKRHGLAFASENRKEEALIQVLSARANMCLAGLSRIAPGGLITRRREHQFVQRRVDELQIKIADPETRVASLSGGNQQKVVIANWLNVQPQIILLDEPTRGIDVQAKQQIFQIIRDLSARGISCVIVSSELEELIEVCHRILVMRRGRLVGEVAPAGVTMDRLLAMCMEA